MIKQINKRSFNLKKVKPHMLVLYVGLFALAVFCLLPFYLMIINASRSTAQIVTEFSLLPGSYLIKNYISVSDTIPVWSGLKNSAIIAVSSTILAGYFSALTAYGFAKFKFKGSTILFGCVLGLMMVPGQLGMLGYFKLVLALDMINSFLPLILPNVVSASTVFFLMLYIRSYVDNSIIEAARIDGSGEFRTFNSIILRMIMPAIATMSIFNFVGYWNNLMSPLIMLQTEDKFTLPLLISNLRGPYLRDWGATYMAVAISIIPIIIAYSFLSQLIIDGLTLGAVKG